MSERTDNFRNVLVVQPSWLGDVVMATPTLRALRQRFPDARITYLARRWLRPIFAGMPWADRVVTYRPGQTSVIALGARLRSAGFDLAVLLPNSFKSALLARLAGASRIVGYDRDGRRLLLTDRLPVPHRAGRSFVPSPILPYYLGLAQHLGADVADRRMELFITDAERREADAIFDRLGVMSRPLVYLNPGANYGAAKIWPVEHFALLADRLRHEHGATVLIGTAPKERKIAEAILSCATFPHVDLGAHKPSLGAIKEIVRRCDLMVTNDTGPRHIAAAVGTPIVTLFGPTHPAWTTIDFPLERQLSIPVDCGPCQLKTCPLDHRCMKGLSVEMAMSASTSLLRGGRPLPVIDAN